MKYFNFKKSKEQKEKIPKRKIRNEKKSQMEWSIQKANGKWSFNSQVFSDRVCLYRNLDTF